ncbi:MAG: hypothetical protein KJ066_03210 [Acidobacteria bacterium]|nr:hypothetical protein [Acidobacteriota bacterium]
MPCSSPWPAGDTRGSALLVVVVLSGAMAVLAGTLAMHVLVDWRMTTHQRRADQAMLAAESAITLSVDELGRVLAWTDALTGSVTSDYRDGPLVVPLESGGAVDLAALGVALQARTDARTAGPNRPQWRLWLWGDLAALVPLDAPGPWPSVAVWVADDEDDGDGQPLADTNSTVRLQAVAVGPGPEQAWLGALVRRVGGTDVEIVTWHRDP